MRKNQIAVLLLLTLCCSMAFGEITLKKNFFTGWKYSVDGGEFKKVGFSGSSLYLEMQDNEKAQLHMKKYKSAKTWAAVTGYPGGFLVGWPLGAYLGSGGEWKDSYTTMIIIGAPLAVISIVFEGSATRNLKKAVRLFNGESESLDLRLDFESTEAGRAITGFLGLKYEF